MPINFINEKDLNNYIAEIVYRGEPIETFTSTDFQSIGYVEQHKDSILRSMIYQWAKYRLRSYLKDEESAFMPLAFTDDLPEWAKEKLGRGEKVFWFSPEKLPTSLQSNIEYIRNYLYALAEKYVNKVISIAKDSEHAPKIKLEYLKNIPECLTFEKTLEEAKKWHELLAKNINTKKNAHYSKKSQEGIQKIMNLPDGMSIVRLMTSEALDFESDNMGHCVGKGDYDKGVKEGSTIIYSLRDASGEPHATFEVRKGEVHQCKGKGNKCVNTKYIPFIQKFIKKSKLEIRNDLKNIGLIKLDGKYYNIFDIPKNKTFVIEGDLDLSDMGLTKLPDLSNIIVKGEFNCSDNKLSSLEGVPHFVGGDFFCNNNQLTSLQGAPQSVKGSFSCDNNQLTSLVGAPQSVKGSFSCDNNQLTSLVGAPRSVQDSFFCNNNQLTSLVGAPRSVKGSFFCNNNQLTSLQGAPQSVRGGFSCDNNQLSSLEGVPQSIGSSFSCDNNQLTTLQGAPQSVEGHFSCNNNQLTSLQGAPQSIGSSFSCDNNQLTSLVGAPRSVKGSFSCNKNRLTKDSYVPHYMMHYFDKIVADENTLKIIKDAANKKSSSLKENLKSHEMKRANNQSSLPPKSFSR